ncbi:MAG TPA: hypothetical protein VI756_00845 [Blastocatellia bacterium]
MSTEKPDLGSSPWAVRAWNMPIQPSLFGPANEWQVSELPAVTEAEIICGDCCGDGAWPKTTYATEQGTCSVCGGRSYVVAEDFGMRIFTPTAVLEAAELKEIWRLGALVGLIQWGDGRKDFARWRAWLSANFGVQTTRELSAPDRIRCMNKLRLKASV